jgi:hypothetical protein
MTFPFDLFSRDVWARLTLSQGKSPAHFAPPRRIFCCVATSDAAHLQLSAKVRLYPQAHQTMRGETAGLGETRLTAMG